MEGNRIELATPLVVLLIEEDTLLSFFTAEFLQDATFEVLEAGTADEALTLLQMRSDVNAVMACLEITGTINGLGLAAAVAARWPAIALIVYSDEDQPGDADLPPSSVFVKKPYDPVQIVTLIERLVKDRRSRNNTQQVPAILAESEPSPLEAHDRQADN